MSCSTMPSNDTSVVLSQYQCQTTSVQISIILWCCSLGSIILLAIWRKNNVISEISKFFSICDALLENDVKVKYKMSLKFLMSLQKLAHACVAFTLIVILCTVPLYGGFELSLGRINYKTHFIKYDYVLSGVFLKSELPAIALLCIYVFLSGLFLLIFFRIFILDWNLLIYSCIPRQDNIKIQFTFNLCLVVYRYSLVFIFLFISFGINGVYILLLTIGNYTSLVQLGFVIVNITYGYGVRWLVQKFFKDFEHHTTESISLYSIFGTFTTLINPCLAVFILDSNCFNEYIQDPETISSSYNFQYCGALFPDFTCNGHNTYVGTSEFVPSPLYSHQCRNAIFGNYIPVVILNCVISTFYLTAIYLYGMTYDKDLRPQTFFCVGNIYYPSLCSLVSLKTEDLIFFDEILYSIHSILQNFVMILLFGTVYYFCAFVLGVDTIVRIFTLSRGILFYIHHYTKDSQLVTAHLKMRQNNLELLCDNARRNILYILWPGLGTSSLIFGLYLFDMAWDTESNDIKVPFILLLLK